MANQKHAPEKRADFKRRIAEIEMRIPANYSQKIHAQTGVSKDIIRNVRHGKTINFKILRALEKLAAR